MDGRYEAPGVEVLGTLHGLTLNVKAFGGTFDGTYLKVKGVGNIPLSDAS